MGAPSEQPNGSGLPCGGFGIGSAPSDVNRCRHFLGRKVEGQSGESETGAPLARRDMPMEATCPNGEGLPANEHGRWMKSKSPSAALTYNTRIEDLTRVAIARYTIACVASLVGGAGGATYRDSSLFHSPPLSIISVIFPVLTLAIYCGSLCNWLE